MDNCVGGNPIENLGVSKLLSRIVTLTHTAGCISGGRKNLMLSDGLWIIMCPSTHCHAKSLFHLYLPFHASGGSIILYETLIVCIYDILKVSQKCAEKCLNPEQFSTNFVDSLGISARSECKHIKISQFVLWFTIERYIGHVPEKRSANLLRWSHKKLHFETLSFWNPKTVIMCLLSMCIPYLV